MHRAAVVLTIAALFWTAAVLAAPAALAHPALATPSAVIYAGASRICHQRPERSFHLAGRQLPVCARCFGLYLAGAFGAVAAWAGRRGAGPRTRLALAVAAIPTAMTWTAEAAGLAGFSNTTRTLAALPLGAVSGWVFVRMLRYDAVFDGHQIDDSRSHVRGG